MAIDSIFYGRVRTIHFIGIGGIGMSGIAEIMLSLGLKVHGSDLNANESVKKLEERGATVHIGHDASNLNGADVVVTSTAIQIDNPEVKEAHKRHIPVVARAEMLAELMRLKYGIAVAGSHGKTTTTSIISTVLKYANLDPTVVIGGKVNQLGSNALLGKGSFIVAEADESDGSFTKLSPSISVITNIDPEHLDYWKGGIQQIKSEFENFANKVPFFGLNVVCTDCDNVRAILPSVNRRVATYAIKHEADYRAVRIRHEGLNTHFDVEKKGTLLGSVEIQLVGKHNVQNTLAAIAVADELGLSFEIIKEALSKFQGVLRRFTLVGQTNDISVIDDYGHHPTEIRSVLEACKVTFPSKRLIVLFQPHRYTRTHHLFEDFANAFTDADQVFLTDIYPAGEQPIEGISSASLAQACHEAGHTQVCSSNDLETSVQTVTDFIEPGDVVLTLGAGNITTSAKQILENATSRFEVR